MKLLAEEMADAFTNRQSKLERIGDWGAEKTFTTNFRALA